MLNNFKAERERVDRLIDPAAVEEKDFQRHSGATLDKVATQITKLFDDDGITTARITQATGRERTVTISAGGQDIFSVVAYMTNHNDQFGPALTGRSVEGGKFDLLDGHHYPKASSSKELEGWVADVLAALLRHVTKR